MLRVPIVAQQSEEYVTNLTDLKKQVTLSETALPSACCYTFENTYGQLNAVELSRDCTLIAGAFDDSIVRGTTSVKIVEMVRDAGAAEVHMRISSPPTTHSCFYGIDTPERSKLLAAKHDLQGMADIIGVDSLAFISWDGLYRAVGEPSRDIEVPKYCDACFTGEYPIPLTDRNNAVGPRQLSLLEEG